jgi:hypothetical protein
LFQVAYSGNGLFYNGITLLQTEAYTPETGAVWELALADRVTQGPFIVKNHYTGALETLVQDENNLIHLISANGKVIWSKQLEGQIRSEVHQVDVYKNKKLQMLFNTDQKLHLLDRNGNSVESYPVKLPAEPSTSVSVADYDGSRDYRFFIPLSDGQILCYAITGKQVDGWDFKPVSEKIVLPVRHIRIKRKDYLFTVLAKGEILLLNRRGKPRYEAKQNADGLFSDNYLIEEGGQIGTTALYYADSSGTMYRLEFGGGLEKIRPQSSVLLDYAVDDFDGDGSVDFAFLYPEELGVYEFSGDVSFEVTLPEEMKNATLSFYSENNLKRIAITDQDREQIYLFDEEGNQSSAIPVFGSTVPAMGDINLNGYPDLITADGSGYVYAYAVK